MGEIASALGAVKQAKAAIGSNGADQSDPGVQLQPLDLPGTPMQDLGAGMSQAMGPQQAVPSSGGLGLMDLIGAPQPNQPALAPQAAPTDNPYTPYDNPQNPAASLGTQDDQTPITITKDTYEPRHKEGWLGKALDIVEMLKGRGTPFKDRKDQENIEDLMKTYKDNPQLALKRIMGINPQVGLNVQQSMDAHEANAALTEQRNMARRDAGAERLGNMTGYLATQKNPDTVYTKMLPSLRSYAQQSGYTPEEAQNMLPDQYDPDKIGMLRMGSMSAYQQETLKQGTLEHQDLQQQRQDEINLREQALGIEGYNAKTARMNAETNSTYKDIGSMANRQALYKQVLGGAASIPWLYGGFLKGVFGSGSSGLPQPGTAYVSPDKTMAVKLNSNGSWSVYDVTKGTKHAREIQRLGGVVGGGGQDFSD